MPRPDTNKVYGARQLSIGCEKGLDVWELQVKLIGWGSGSDNDGIGNAMDPVRLTGEFDSTTRDAVMRFEKGHKLPVTGIVDGPLFSVIDREVALHPVMMHSLRCPCVTGANDGPIVCRCTKHPGDGECKTTGDGFGKGGFPGKFLLDTKKLGDEFELKDEKLDVYDMEEYAGMDKTVLWAVRALMHRSDLQSDSQHKPVQVTAGYRCWNDNYHHADDIRWRHRRSTFHFGKAIEFYVLDHCSKPKWEDTTASCPQCDLLRTTAREKCGFQLRWQQPGRVAIAEGVKDNRPPVTPFAVHIDTVRLHARKGDHSLEYKNHFVKTDKAAAEPLYGGNLVNISYPLVLEEGVTDAWPLPDEPDRKLAIRRALDPKFASGEEFFRNTETGPGGWYPLGLSRTWHGGIHLKADEDTPVHAIADGEIVGCRAGQDESQPNGSHNFVLIRHTVKGEDADPWKDKVFWSLYMHLDGEPPKVDAKIRWRRELFARSKKCAEALVPTPILEKKVIETKDRLVPKPGLTVGETRAVTGAEIVAKTKDDLIPDEWKIFALEGLVDHYVFATQKTDTITEIREAVADVADGKVKGLKNPIRVSAGEVIGYVGKAATEDPAKKLGTFLHLETFSDARLPVSNDFVDISVGAVDKLADRKDAVAKIVAAKLLPDPPDHVLTADELKNVYLHPPYSTKFRSTLLKMASTWSVEWKDVIAAPKSLAFLTDPDAMAEKWNSYNWWNDVKAGNGVLPADNTQIYHYHPIALILQMTYR